MRVYHYRKITLTMVSCLPLWSGDYCQDEWVASPAYYGCFITYTVYEILLQAFCVVYSSRQLYVIFRYNPKTRRSIPTVILIVCVIAGIRMNIEDAF